MKYTKRNIAITSLLLVSSMLLAACGADATPTSVPAPPTATTGQAAGATTPTAASSAPTTAPAATTGASTFSGTTIKIAVDLPTSGADATDGIPTRNGVELAIAQANAAGGVTIAGKSYQLAMYALDDAVNGLHDPGQGVKNVQLYIADPAVLAMVGPFNSNVAEAEMPILNTAGLANISPSNTNETLTKPQFGQTGTYRPTGVVTYFRVCTTDDIQGPAGADFMYDTLKARNVYFLNDLEAYGQGLANNAAAEFMKKGGTVIKNDGVPAGTQDFSTILTAIQATKPDAIYYGGTASNGLPLARKQMVGMGFNVPFVGGDGIQDAQFTNVAGTAGNGSYSTVAAVNSATLPSAKDFLAAYKTKYGTDVGAYSANAYDATNIIIAAMKAAAGPDRGSVRTAIAATNNYMGVIGSTTFDANGDTSNKWISIYEVQNGAWVYQSQIHFGQ